MRRAINNMTENIQSQMNKQSQRNKTFPANKLSATFLKNNGHENCLPFNSKDYPFLNDTKNDIKSYKTLLNASLYADKIQKIISINHKNIVQLQKISKSSGKSILGKESQIHYSLFYEVIPYSLKAIAFSSKKQACHLPHLTSLEICQQLVEVSQYLMSIEVFYCLRLDDIGVSFGGEIKVFISPHVLLNLANKKPDRGDVMTSIDMVMGWWGTTISTKGDPKNRKIQITGLSNSLGFTTDSSNTLTNKKNSTSSFIIRNRQSSEEDGDIRKMAEIHKPQSRPKSPITMQKMKKIDEEIKLMRQVMQQKVKNRIRKQSADAVADKNKETKLKCINNISFESVKLSKPEITEQLKNPQSIQQNINCINIYNHSQAEKATKPLKKNKKMQAKPMYSYTIKPNNDLELEYHKLNYNKVNNSLSPEDQIYHQEDNYSIDTYQMDLGYDYEPISPINTPAKQLFNEKQREKSEQNYKAKREEEKPKGEKKGNQVAVKKNVTQSAGPMQFKSFVVNFIKPQFLAKKSNIYQDPGEYESENSGSKHISQHYHDLNDVGKSATSHTQKSSSLGREKIDNKEDYNRKYKIMSPQDPNVQKKNQTNIKKACILSKVNGLSVIPSNRQIINQKSEGIICYRKLEDLQIGQKIKMALEKTKNAIALLNRVKLAKSPKHFETIHS